MQGGYTRDVAARGGVCACRHGRRVHRKLECAVRSRVARVSDSLRRVSDILISAQTSARARFTADKSVCVDENWRLHIAAARARQAPSRALC
eukprot:1675058-Pleurochrysis_carterae.AAC.4